MVILVGPRIFSVLKKIGIVLERMPELYISHNNQSIRPRLKGLEKLRELDTISRSFK